MTKEEIENCKRIATEILAEDEDSIGRFQYEGVSKKILNLIATIESKDSELESARKNYDELLDEINEEYSKSAALKKIIEEREVELTSAKDEIDRLVSRCDTYYAKLEEQQKEIEERKRIQVDLQMMSKAQVEEIESLTKQLSEMTEKAEKLRKENDWLREQINRNAMAKEYKEGRLF